MIKACIKGGVGICQKVQKKNIKRIKMKIGTLAEVLTHNVK